MEQPLPPLRLATDFEFEDPYDTVELTSEMFEHKKPAKSQIFPQMSTTFEDKVYKTKRYNVSSPRPYDPNAGKRKLSMNIDRKFPPGSEMHMRLMCMTSTKMRNRIYVDYNVGLQEKVLMDAERRRERLRLSAASYRAGAKGKATNAAYVRPKK
jgi:hypothetical protein